MTVRVARAGTVTRWRPARGRRAPVVVVAPAGSFERWELAVGDTLGLHELGRPGDAG